MKRTLLLLAILLLLVPGMVAFGQAKTTIKFVNYLYSPSDDPSWVGKFVAEKYPDVEFKVTGIMAATYYDQLNVMIAGGDVPDVIFQIDSARSRILVDQGVMMEVPYALIKENMPKTWATMKKFGDEVFMACYFNGKNYGIPIVNESQTFPFTDGIRADWLKKVGLGMPTTVEQLDAVFKAFTKNDPDGNGKADTYAFTTRGKDAANQIFPQLYGAYKAWPGGWMQNVDGTLTHGSVVGGLRDVYRWLNKWYMAGYMDPEFVTHDNAAVRDRWTNGQIGYAVGTTWYRLYPTGEYYDPIMTLNPKAEIALVPAVKGPTGSYGYLGWGKATGNYGFSKAMEKRPDAVKRVMQIFEAFNTDPAIYGPITWGQESVHWQRATNGQAIYIAPYNDAQKRGPIGNAFWAKFGNWDMQMLFAWPKNVADLTKYAQDRNWAPEKGYTHFVQLSADGAKLQNGTLQPLWQSWMMKFITGEKSVETDWTNYVAEMKAAGMDKLTAEANAFYKNVRGFLADIAAKTK